MVDLVYPLSNGSRWHNNEIRFSLRSVKKYLQNYGEVHVFGEQIDFLDVNKYPCQEFGLIKETNIFKKILAACYNDQVSDPFLFMNDDHYLNREFDAFNFPNYYEDTISATIFKRYVKDDYTEAMCNTYRSLVSKGLPQKYFDVHTPMLIDKKQFIAVMGQYDWSGKGNIVKSLYLNSIRIEGTPTTDAKLQRSWSDEAMQKALESAPVISSGPGRDKRLMKWLNLEFPYPSPWELNSKHQATY